MPSKLYKSSIPLEESNLFVQHLYLRPLFLANPVSLIRLFGGYFDGNSPIRIEDMINEMFMGNAMLMDLLKLRKGIRRSQNRFWSQGIAFKLIIQSSLLSDFWPNQIQDKKYNQKLHFCLIKKNARCKFVFLKTINPRYLTKLFSLSFTVSEKCN